MVKYRVWFHNKRGDDTYQEFTSKSQAMNVARRTPSAEKVIYELLNGTEKPIALTKPEKTKFVKKRKKQTGIAGVSLKMPKFRF